MCVHELKAELSVFLSLQLLTLIGKHQSGHLLFDLLFLFSIQDVASIPAHGQYTVICRRRKSK